MESGPTVIVAVVVKVAVETGVTVIVGELVTVAVGVRVGVLVMVKVAVEVPLLLGVAEMVGVAELVTVKDAVDVIVFVGVGEGVEVAVFIWVEVAVPERETGVFVGAGGLLFEGVVGLLLLEQPARMAVNKKRGNITKAPQKLVAGKWDRLELCFILKPSGGWVEWI